MMFKAIVVFVSLNATSFQLEDTLGFHKTEFACYARASEIIKVTSQKMPILHASALCLDLSKLEPPKKSETKPTKKEENI